MKFREKASALTLCAVLLGTSVAPISAATKTEIIGANRYETAAKIADKMGNYDTAILVNADKSLADGLSASSLAGKEDAPILLVKRDSIPAATMQRLKNVKKVYIIGGNAAIGSNVTGKLSDKEVTRIEGRNRIETSENVAKVVGDYDEAFIVNGNKGEADAMSVAAVAARDKAPIILTNGKSSNQDKKSGVEYFVVGGEAVVSNSLVNKFGAVRLSGSNRYTTNRAVVKKFYSNTGKHYYTKGDLLVDALTVSSLAKNNGVVLVSANSDNSILKDKNVVQVGGINFNVNFDAPAKPDENKPVKPDEQKPDEQKPSVNNTKPKFTYRTLAIMVEQNQPIDFSEYGIKAYDAEDGDITSKIKYDKIPDTSIPGSHNFKATVTDKGGLTAVLRLNVYVNEYNPEYDTNSAEYLRRARAEFNRLLHKYREDENKKALAVDARAERMSQLKCEHMVKYNYFDHSYEGKYIHDLYPEVEGNGPGSLRHEFENLYMNIGLVQSPEELAKDAFDTWVHSTGHNAALLYNDADCFGFAVRKASNGKVYAAYHIGSYR